MKEADKILFIYAAPAGDETLTPDDAVHILEEILPAKIHYYVISLLFNLPKHVVDGIHSKKPERRNHLSSEISALNIQKSRYLNQRSCLQEEKGKMKKVIVFLQDAQISMAASILLKQSTASIAQHTLET